MGIIFYNDAINMSKIVIYQVLPRLFGNNTKEPVFNGSIKQNGCGKFQSFTLGALRKIKELGVTHIWYTGVIEHATQTDYREFGIRRDHSAMVKGKAGSPYAIKDYYDVDPDLARNPAKRMGEFESLIERTHRVGLKIIIDFVPNHVAREYHSDVKPNYVNDLGENDNTAQAFCPNNNFYYIPGQPLACRFDMTGTDMTPYKEFPAKATGNDFFSPFPEITDWYETVKLNYGVDYCGGRIKHFSPIPDTWEKMLDILFFWSEKHVDAFRCDMAEMIPLEFWHWAIPQIKNKYPNILFIGEVYNPSMYRDFIYKGNFDYLYDKVGLYDTLRAVIRMECGAQAITSCWQQLDDIRDHMLYFLENHDEQRLASPFFANDALKGIPALAVSVLMGTNPFMLYFGQEFGEKGMDKEGFSGLDGRTSIFDYWKVTTIQQWRNNGKYNMSDVSPESKSVYVMYKHILNLAQTEPVFIDGLFYDLMYVNCDNPNFDANRTFVFVRSTNTEACLIVCNFSDNETQAKINIPRHMLDFLKITPKKYKARNLITNEEQLITVSENEQAKVAVSAWGVLLLKFSK